MIRSPEDAESSEMLMCSGGSLCLGAEPVGTPAGVESCGGRTGGRLALLGERSPPADGECVCFCEARGERVEVGTHIGSAVFRTQRLRIEGISLSFAIKSSSASETYSSVSGAIGFRSSPCLPGDRRSFSAMKPP